MMKNKFTIWLANFIRLEKLRYQYKDKKLKIESSVKIYNSTFGFYNTLYKGSVLHNVDLLDFSYVGVNTKISNTKIGKFCSIGPDCKIGLAKHPTTIFVSSHPIFYSSLGQVGLKFTNENYFKEYEDIDIGNDVWIGSDVIISNGVTISDGAVIATGTVVTKDVPAYAIVGGVPAKIIKYRFSEHQIKQLLEIKWWEMNVEYLKKNFKQFHNIDNFFAFAEIKELEE